MQLSPTPIGSKNPIPIGDGRRDDNDDDDKSFVESYSVDSVEEVESQSEDKRVGGLFLTSDSSELHQRMYEATQQLAKEGEKNVSLALELQKTKDDLAVLQEETESFRSALLQGINGGVSDSNNYRNVGLDELLRLRMQEAAPSSDLRREGAGRGMIARNESSVGVIQSLEHKLRLEADRNEALEARCLSLKAELEAKQKHEEGVENLRLKVSQMVRKLRTEREVKSKFQRDLAVEKKKVEALSDHIEKLMVHLKHEAIAKARSFADQSHLQREMEMMKVRNSTMAKKNDRKDQVIAEMRESAKLLEDQLRLMDEKYMELRSKLDWTREQTTRILKRKDEEVKQLRSQQVLLADYKGGAGMQKQARTATTRGLGREPPVLEGRKSVVELNKKLNRRMAEWKANGNNQKRSG